MSENNKSYYNIDGYRMPRLPALSYEEFIVLYKRYKSGDVDAGKKIVEHNYGLVVKECSSYPKDKIPTIELFQEGCLGVMEAVKRYDINSGCMFSTYAIWWIKQRMSSYIAENYYKWTVGKDMYQLIKKINYLECQLSAKYGREVTREKIAQELDVSVEKINYALKILNREVSLDDPLRSGEGESEDTIGEFVPSTLPTPEELAEKKDKREAVLEVLDMVCSNEREKEVILKRFGFYGSPQSLSEIAKEFNVTNERIRQIESKVLRKIRGRYSSRLKPYYDDDD